MNTSNNCHVRPPPIPPVIRLNDADDITTAVAAAAATVTNDDVPMSSASGEDSLDSKRMDCRRRSVPSGKPSRFVDEPYIFSMLQAQQSRSSRRCSDPGFDRGDCADDDNDDDDDQVAESGARSLDTRRSLLLEEKVGEASCLLTTDSVKCTLKTSSKSVTNPRIFENQTEAESSFLSVPDDNGENPTLRRHSVAAVHSTSSKHLDSIAEESTTAVGVNSTSKHLQPSYRRLSLSAQLLSSKHHKQT